MENVNIEDLEWYERTPDILYGKDKDGNVYGISDDGDLVPVSRGKTDSLIYYSTVEEAKALIAFRKKNAGDNLI